MARPQRQVRACAPKKTVKKASRKGKAKPRRSSRKKTVKRAQPPRKSPAKARQRQRAAAAVDEALGQAGKALDGIKVLDFTHVQSGPTCTQLARLYGRRLHQGRTPRRRRHHARAIARRERRGLPLLHDAQRQQALDHDRLQASQGQGNPRSPDQALRRAGGEFRARRARPHGADLGAHQQAQSAHDRRLGEGLRPWPLRGMQGLREHRAMRRRLGLDHGLPRRPAAGHRRADRRQRHRAASRLRHRLRAASSATAPAAARRCSPRCRTACSISRASSCATSSASRMGRSPNTASTAKAFRSARRCRAPATIPAAASPAGSSNARAGRTIPNAYIYFITQAPVWGAICDIIGKPEWKTDPDYATPRGAAAAA